MNENDFDELLAAIDTPTDAPLDVEERVWQTLRSELFAEQNGVGSPIDGDGGAASHIVDLDLRTPTIDSADDGRRLGTASLLGAVAVAAIVIGLVGVLLADRANNVDIADDPAPPISAPIDRPEACFRFRVDHPLFDDIEANLTIDPDTTPELIESTREGLVQLQADLSTIGALSEPNSTELFLTLDGALNQARLFVLASNVDAAQQAIDLAQETYRDSELAEDSCLGAI